MSTSVPPLSSSDKVLTARPTAASWLPWVREPHRMLAASLVLGLGAEVLLDRPAWGVAFPVMAVATLAALAWLGGREGWERARPNAWLAAPLLVFSGFVAVRDSPWLLALNVLASGVLLMLLAHFWAAGRVQRLGLGGYPLAVLTSALQVVRYPPALARDTVDLSGVRRHAPRLWSLARGLLLAVPVLVVFGALLESADVAFASAVERVLSLDLVEVFGDAVGRAVGAGVAACVAAGVLGHALRRRGVRELGEAEAAPAKPRLGFIEALMLILSVDALFLVFAGFQVAYLFIGGASSPAPGYSFAEYARRGFFELVLVSTLTLVLVMALTRWTRRESPVADGVFRAGASLMVALTLVLLASAVKRMALYEDAFGYTHLRLYTHVFMYALGAVLAWRGVTLWWRPERFAIGAFVTALGAVLAINVVNPDAFIVRHNLELHESTGEVDVAYLRGLSADAVPELARRLPWVQPEWAAQVLEHHAARLQREESLPEWNLSRWWARRALQEVGHVAK